MSGTDAAQDAWPHHRGEMAARIRALDWSASLGPIECWPPALTGAVDFMLGIGFPAILLWGQDFIQIYNDRHRDLMGIKHPSGLGEPARTCWPEVWGINAPIYERVRRGETVTYEDALYRLARFGAIEDAWFTLTYAPVREGSRVAGVFVAVIETTERVLAQRRLEDSEARFKALATAGAHMLYRMSPDWRRMYQLSGRDTLADTVEPEDDWAEKYLPPEDRPAIFAAIDKAIRERSLFQLEHRVRLADGGVGWVMSRAAPVVSPSGEILEWFGAGVDVTQRKRQEIERRRIDALYRTLFDTMDEAFCVTEVVMDANGAARDLVLRDVNAAFERQTGLADVVGRRVSELLPSLEPWWLDYHAHVVATGESIRRENYMQDVGRWFNAHYSLLGDRGSRLVAVVFDDVTDRKRAEAVLRASEERQAFLLRLGDALRSESDADAAIAHAVDLLFEKLGLDRCCVVALDEAAGRWNVRQDRRRPSLRALPQTLRVEDFPASMRAAADHTLVFPDIATMTTLTDEEKSAIQAMGHGAIVAPRLRKGTARQLWAMIAVSQRPRRWTGDEVMLIEEAAERAWDAAERIRAAAALRESEERFRQFGDASSDVLWVRNLKTLNWEYLSPAFEMIYGVSRAQAMAGQGLRNWLDLILEEDRPHAAAAISRVRERASISFEYRVRRPDGQVRWLRDTDFPMHGASGEVERIGGVGRDVTEEKRAAAHTQTLVAELQHRTRNLIAVIRSIAAQTLAETGPTPAFEEEFSGRLDALARVQSLLSRTEEEITVEALVRLELNALGAQELPGRLRIEGPPARVRRAATQILALALHELATNARKYGALSNPRGRLAILWRIETRGAEQILALRWLERIGDPPRMAASTPKSSGFGRDLIERALPYSLKAKTQYHQDATRVRCVIEMPLFETT